MATDDRKPTKTRREQGSGAVYRRSSDGRYVAVVDLGWKDGKRQRRSFVSATEGGAIAKLNRAMAQLGRGALMAADKQTVAQFLDHWLAAVVKPTLRPKTYQSYESICRIHIIPAIGRRRLDKLGVQHVAAMLADCQAAGCSPTTVRYVRTVLKKALADAVRWEVIPRNVAALVKPPLATRFEGKPLSPEDAGRFLLAARGDRLEALFTVAVALGLRLGEAFGLRWQDVNLDTGTLTVRHQLQRIDKVYRLTEPKSPRSRRTLPLPAPVLASLKAHRQRQLEDRLLAGGRWDGSWNLVFCSTIGTPLDDANVRTAYAAILDKAGLEHRRFHDLRHSAGSFLVARGVHPRVVMEILGHSDIRITMNLYAHVIDASVKDALDQWESVFDPDKRSS